MAGALTIRRDVMCAEDLRKLAKCESSWRTAARMLAIANAMNGMSRADAARLAGLERQALRKAVLRFNSEGLTGLKDRPSPGRPPILCRAEQALLRARLARRYSEDEDEDWTLPRLCAWIEATFGKRLHRTSLSRLLRTLDVSVPRYRSKNIHSVRQSSKEAGEASNPS